MSESTLTAMVIASTIFTVFLFLLPAQYKTSTAASNTKSRSDKSAIDVTPGPVSVQVLVLGDIGRSPRMQYHALSIAKGGGFVQLIGYMESEPLPALVDHPRVAIIPLANPPRAWQTSHKLLFLVFAPMKVFFQIWSLWMVLAYRTKPAKWMLVQNPPSIPTLAVAAVVCFLRSTQLVIDWHNFGYSILAMKLSAGHPLVKISQTYERALAKTAKTHFTVTHAMARALRNDFGLDSPIYVLHDRPADLFQPFSEQDRRAFLLTNHVVSEYSDAILNGKARLLVSSTSWTPDEDFSILIDALCRYSEKAASTHPQLPQITAIITGRGPQKTKYLHQIAQLQGEGKFEMVSIKLAWLSFEDYAALLASADLGVSLHTSSSGVDLPMKVVDMFGVGLPVVGWSKYEAWPELVTENVNGKGFCSPDQLANILMDLFEPDTKQLLELKRGAIAEAARRWDEEWDPIAGKLFGLPNQDVAHPPGGARSIGKVFSDIELKAQLMRSAAALSLGIAEE